MADQEKELRLKIIMDNTGAIKGVEQLNKVTKEHQSLLEGMSGRVTTAIDKIKKNWLAYTAAIGSTVVMIKKTVGAYADQEKAERLLQNAFAKTSKNAKELTKDFAAWASEQQKSTSFADEVIVRAGAQLEAFAKLDSEGLKKVIRSTMDFAVAQGMDLVSAANLVGKSIGSDTNALSRYGIELSKTNDISVRTNELMTGINAKFGGFADEEGKSAVGQIEQMKNAFGELEEEIGRNIFPTLTPFIKLIKDLSIGFGTLPEPLKKVGAALVILIPIVLALNSAFGPMGLLITGVAIALGGTTAAVITSNKEMQETIRTTDEFKNKMIGEVAAMGDVSSQIRKQVEERKKEIAQLKELIALYEKENPEAAIKARKRIAELEKEITALLKEKTPIVKGIIGLSEEEKKVIDGLKEKQKQQAEFRLAQLNDLQKKVKKGSEEEKLILKEVDAIKEEIAQKEKERTDKDAQDKKLKRDDMIAQTKDALSQIDSIAGQFAENEQLRIENEKTLKLNAVKENEDAELAAQRALFDQGKITKEEYEKAITSITDKYSSDRVEIEKTASIESQKAKRSDAIFNKISGAIQAGVNTAVGVTAALASLNIPLSIIIGILGAAQVAAILAKPIPEIQKFREGGRIGGYGGGDIVPALLEPGEYVMTKESSKFYGREFFDNLNAMRFATGGAVPSPNIDQSNTETVDNRKINISVSPTNYIDFVNTLKRTHGLKVFS